LRFAPSTAATASARNASGEKYVDGRAHKKGLENFWRPLKRGLNGTYISVQPFHLFRYLDERLFGYNLRDLTKLGRFPRSSRYGRERAWRSAALACGGFRGARGGVGSGRG